MAAYACHMYEGEEPKNAFCGTFIAWHLTEFITKDERKVTCKKCLAALTKLKKDQ